MMEAEIVDKILLFINKSLGPSCRKGAYVVFVKHPHILLAEEAEGAAQGVHVDMFDFDNTVLWDAPWVWELFQYLPFLEKLEHWYLAIDFNRGAYGSFYFDIRGNSCRRHFHCRDNKIVLNGFLNDNYDNLCKTVQEI